MKTILFLCGIAFVICSVTSDDENNNYGIDASFFKKEGLSTLCGGNQTFGSYQLCTKTCEQMKFPDDCPDVTRLSMKNITGQISDFTWICIGA
ncbi:TIL domain-containing protein [Trichonephila clavata]|uniref:TIL domain-containing protein n=1 Tax=Trichonephila clavata TaxID=2740835 RepID=A0A8X6KTR8_TRICU|nr:TIL domain-containing protein [Trichonephila clavata]